jgi:hypothetical protein
MLIAFHVMRYWCTGRNGNRPQHIPISATQLPGARTRQICIPRKKLIFASRVYGKQYRLGEARVYQEFTIAPISSGPRSSAQIISSLVIPRFVWLSNWPQGMCGAVFPTCRRWFIFCFAACRTAFSLLGPARWYTATPYSKTIGAKEGEGMISAPYPSIQQ